MKKQIFTFIKITALAAILAVGVSYVSAASWSAPGTDATGGNTVAGINTSSYNQTKIGSFATNSFLKAGNAFSSLNAPWNKAGYLVGEKAIIAPWSFFTYSFLPGNTSQVKIGSNNADTTDPFTGAITPFTIDLVGRGGYNTSGGRNMIDIRTDTNMCHPNATIRTNTSSIALYNEASSDYASPIVRGVQLSGGDPAPGKILVSADAKGNAIWATPEYNSGTNKITFTYGTSPVATGQALCSPPPPPTCTGGNYTPISTPTCDFNTYVKRTTRDTPDNPDATSEAGVYSAKGCLVRKSGYIAGAADQCQFIPVEDVSDVPATAPAGYVFASSCKETVNAGQYENTYQLGKINNCQVSTPTCTSANTYKITRYKNGVVDETFGPAPLGPCYFKVVNETRYLGGGGRGCFIVPADEFYPERHGGTWYETHTDIGYTCQVINTHNSGDYVTYKIEKHP